VPVLLTGTPEADCFHGSGFNHTSTSLYLNAEHTRDGVMTSELAVRGHGHVGVIEAQLDVGLVAERLVAGKGDADETGVRRALTERHGRSVIDDGPDAWRVAD